MHCKSSFYHLANGCRFAALSRHIFRLKPVECEVRVIAFVLFGTQHSKSEPLSECQPAHACRITLGGLGGPVENDDQR